MYQYYNTCYTDEQNNPYYFLCTKSIYRILDGDDKFGNLYQEGNDLNIEISMPYLSGPELSELCRKFGLQSLYPGSGSPSRWEYLDKLFKFCIRNNKISSLLTFLFSKKQFSKILSNQSKEIIEFAYPQIVNTVIEVINKHLYLCDHELKKIGDKYVVQKIGTPINIESKIIKTIDRNYISQTLKTANEFIYEGRFDSALTKSKTLLEEVFHYVIEKKGQKAYDNDNQRKKHNIMTLYNQVKSLYNMHYDKNNDIRINKLLSGLDTILISISEMRNKESDAHGVGINRMNISEHHARLFVNAAATMADFILSVSEKQLSKQKNI